MIFFSLISFQGHERSGVSCRDLCDATVYLPVFQGRSLNVAVAAGQAAFLVADRWGLARDPRTVRRLGELLAFEKED